MSTELNMEYLEGIINKAAEVAVSKYKEEEKKSKKGRVLRNTELLLKNYNSFVEHYKNAKDDINDLEDFTEEEMMEEDHLYIQAIRRSKFRTMIMVTHINVAMKILNTRMKERGQGEKYKVVEGLYFKEKTFETVAEELHCSEATVRRWKNEMVQELGLLLFGIDGVKLSV